MLQCSFLFNIKEIIIFMTSRKLVPLTALIYIIMLLIFIILSQEYSNDLEDECVTSIVVVLSI